MLLATTKKTWPLRDEQAGREPLGEVMRFSLECDIHRNRHASLLIQSFGIWVMFCILVVLRNVGSLSSMGTLTVKATTEVVSFLKILKTQCSCCGLD
jgi:hypothetical protein